MKHSKIELFRSTKNKQYYIRFRATNGEIVAQSEGYKSKRSARKLPGIINSIVACSWDYMKCVPLIEEVK